MPHSDLLALGQSRSICSPENLQGLIDLVHQVKDVPGDIVEIGSYKCGSTMVLAAASKEWSPSKTVFGFDTFSGMPAVSEFDQHKTGEFGDIDFEEINRTVRSFGNITLVRGTHEETVPQFTHRPISLLFLDSDLYNSHMVSLQHFWPDLVEGGIAVFHDWNTLDCLGVKKAVNDFFNATPIKTSLFNGMLAIQK